MASDLQHRLRALEGRLSAIEPLNYEQFRASWGSMDALSKSVYQEIAASPGLYGAEESARIRGYLDKLGVDVETDPRSMDEILQNLVSD